MATFKICFGISLIVLVFNELTDAQEMDVNCIRVPQKRCKKWCGTFQWIRCNETHVSGANDVNVHADALDAEAAKNPPLGLALEAAKQNHDRIEQLQASFSDIPLSFDEILLIMAYTYDILNQSQVAFYEDLNDDCKDSGLIGGRYPVSKNMLRNALINITKKRPLPFTRLYRQEPISALRDYQDLLNTDTKISMAQFSSLSSVSGAFGCQNDSVDIQFAQPEVGVSIREFSIFPVEEEILLPAFYGTFSVVSVDSVNGRVDIEGPGKSDPPEACQQISPAAAPLANIVLDIFGLVVLLLKVV